MNKYTSILAQMLQLLPRGEFERLVREHGAEYRSKGFSSWGQMAAMLFCHLGGAKSLREIELSLESSKGKLRHLGLREAPNKSTLSYANARRPAELYESYFHVMLRQVQSFMGSRGHRFRFKNPLLSLDSTLITLVAKVFPWARYTRIKGAVKLHMLLDHDGYLPVFACITEGREFELEVARSLHLPPGSIVAIDRGYKDYSLYNSWTEQGVSFVTRQRGDVYLEAVESRPVPEGSGVLRDEEVVFAREQGRRLCPHRLRRVEVQDGETGGTIAFLTNNLKLSARTIAEIYRERWQIETFFKCLKQNLRVKSFVGTSQNAVATQIWTALIAVLLLKYMQFRCRAGWSLSNMVAVLRYNLFVYRDLWEWLEGGGLKPPWAGCAGQLALNY